MYVIELNLIMSVLVFHQEATMIIITEDAESLTVFCSDRYSSEPGGNTAHLQWAGWCFNGVTWRAPTRDCLSSRWHLLIRLSDLKVCPVWVTASERGFMMEELHDVQLTEIKPLLTGQVGSPGGTATCCLPTRHNDGFCALLYCKLHWEHFILLLMCSLNHINESISVKWANQKLLLRIACHIISTVLNDNRSVVMKVFLCVSSEREKSAGLWLSGEFDPSDPLSSETARWAWCFNIGQIGFFIESKKTKQNQNTNQSLCFGSSLKKQKTNAFLFHTWNEFLKEI